MRRTVASPDTVFETLGPMAAVEHNPSSIDDPIGLK